MKRYLTSLCLLFVICHLSFVICHSQSACPSVSITVSSPTVACGGCTSLTASPQGSTATTSYSVTQIPYNPLPYNVGTPVLVNVDDQWSGVITLPFCFEFYGNTYTQCILGSNGIISFDLANAGNYNTWPISAAIPDFGANGPDITNCIMGPWHDIDPSVAGNMYYQLGGTAPCRYLVVSWDNIAMFSCNNLIATQQIILYETTNIIDINIQNKPLCSTWNSGTAIEGIQNAGGTQAVVVPGRNYPTQWTASNDAWRFTPTGAPQYSLTWYEPPNTPIGTALTVTVCPAVSTTYTATVVNNSCSGPITVSATISVNVSLSVSLSSTPTPCPSVAAGSATATVISGNPPYTYQWSNGQTTSTATGLAAGTYTVTVSSASCTITDTISVASLSNFSLTTTTTSVLCNGGSNGSATANPSGGTVPYTYQWNNGAVTQTATGLSAGIYSVTITDASGCTIADTVQITEPSALAVISSSAPDTCGRQQGTASVNVSGGTLPYTYLWLTNPVQSGTSVNGLSAGNITCVVTDANGCNINAVISVGEIPGPAANFFPDPPEADIINPNILFVDLSTNAITYTWDFGDSSPFSNQQSPVHTYQSPGVYTVTLIVANQYGCVDTIWKVVVISEGTSFYIPNTFTPNNDGLNDVFTPIFYNIYENDFSFTIFDRWGNEIFKTTTQGEGWDGKVKKSGEIIQEDVYVYVIIYRDVEQRKYKLVGHVNLVK